MNAYLLFLRMIHIFGSVLWVGSAIFYFFFVKPTVQSIGPGGQAFMQHMMGRRRYPQYMSAVALATILSGALLYLTVSGGLQLGWIMTGPGMGFTLGALFGIVVFFIGLLAIKPRADRMGVIGQQIGASGGRPTPAQASELHRLEQEMSRVELLDFILLSLALLAMGTARYWTF